MESKSLTESEDEGMSQLLFLNYVISEMIPSHKQGSTSLTTQMTDTQSIVDTYNQSHSPHITQ